MDDVVRDAEVSYYEWERTADGASRKRVTYRGKVRLTIALGTLLQTMGSKALKNKTRKATAGSIKVRVLEGPKVVAES